jgi:putative ABC transport system permease protein
MLSILRLAARSLLARKLPVLLCIGAVALASGLLVTTEKIREGARLGFESTISGTDLVVGARTGPLSLVLYSVFRIGDPLQSVSWETFERVAEHPDVAFAVPLSLGDSHRGYRVLGTDERYLAHYRFANGSSLRLGSGTWMEEPRHAVLGSEVAETLGYGLGSELVLSHGIVSAGFADHEDTPFKVSGILRRTGTPVDRTIHVSLQGIELVHSPPGTQEIPEPEAVTAFLVGMKSRPAVLRFQRSLNTYGAEPLTAVIPGVALSRLWSVLGPLEAVLRGVTALVFLVGMTGLMTTLLASLAGRTRELAILRAVGARPRDVFLVVTIETVLVTGMGAFLGFTLANLGLTAAAPLLTSEFGLVLQGLRPGPFDLAVLGAVLGVGVLAGFVPGLAAYRQSLGEGLGAGG